MNTLSAMLVDDGLLITAGGYEDLRAELEALRGGVAPELRTPRCCRLQGHELVGAIEPQVGDGRVSVAAPVGRALVGQRVGARLDVATPGGTRPLEVLSILPANAQPQARKAA